VQLDDFLISIRPIAPPGTPKSFLKTFSEDFGVPGGAIGRIDIKKSFLHFDIDQNYVEKLKKSFNGAAMGGRKLRLDEVDKPTGSGGSFGGFSGGGGNRSGGGGGNRFNDRKTDKSSYRNDKPFAKKPEKKYEQSYAGGEDKFERDFLKDVEDWDTPKTKRTRK
jgi:hypothetical protein